MTKNTLFILLLVFTPLALIAQALLDTQNAIPDAKVDSRADAPKPYYAGDVNGDGFDDWLVSDMKYSDNRGRVWLYFGGSVLDNVPDLLMLGEETGANFGEVISHAGDINLDGYDDWMVGALLYGSRGKAYIYFGGPNPDNVADLTMLGETKNSYFGWVNAGGDVNGDGYPDWFIGSAGYNANTGRVYLFYGSPTPDMVPDLIFSGELEKGLFGRMGAPGDINADGYSDWVIGARSYGEGEYGKAYMYFGGPSPDSTPEWSFTGTDAGDAMGFSGGIVGDVNADGYDDWMTGGIGKAFLFLGGTNPDEIPDYTIEEDSRFVIDAAGDPNDDGIDDWVVSTRYAANLYYGNKSMDNIAIQTLQGEPVVSAAGYTVSKAGDTNGDNIDDIWVGETFALYWYKGVDVPTAFASTDVQSTSFVAHWEEASDQSSYQLDVSEDSLFGSFVDGYEHVAVNGTSASVAGLSANTTYFSRVSALNSNGTLSGYSNVITTLTLPDAPLLLKATQITSSSFVANWNPSDGALYYVLQVSDDASFVHFVEGYSNKTVEGTSSDVVGLTKNRTYYYRVQASNGTALSAHSSSMKVTTATNAPRAIKATDITTSSFTARWLRVKGAVSYRLDVAIDSNFTQFVPGYEDKLVYKIEAWISGLLPSTVYYYRVRAKNEAKVLSAYSNTIKVTTLPSASRELDTESVIGNHVFPNPAVSEANFTVVIPDELPGGIVKIEVYSLQGFLVATLFNAQLPSGKHVLTLPVGQIPSGLYVYHIMASGLQTTGKLEVRK